MRERVPLGIKSSCPDRPYILVLLSPHAKQFGTLDFIGDYWPVIQRFFEATSGPLLPLRIAVVELEIVGPETMRFPSFPSLAVRLI